MENFLTFLLKGLSPAAIDPMILKSLLFFLLNLLVSLELIAKPSNAALLSDGLFSLQSIFIAETLFKQF